MIKNSIYKETLAPWIVLILRLLIGAVFVFSGFVKAIDPWGMLYKLEEYVAALGIDWLSPFLLFGSFTISIVEFCLGVCVVVGAYRRVSVWLSFIMMVVMTILTGWLWVSDAVADCGCFGDAIVMSNAATFVKNILLLLGVVYLLRNNIRLFNIYSHDVQWIVVVISAAYVLTVAVYGYFYQPMLDFRPYKVGMSLAGNDANAESNDVDDFVFVYEKDGEQREFTINNLPSDEDTTWQFVERREMFSKNAEERYAVGLSLSDNGEDVTADVLNADGEQLIFVYSQMNDIGISYTYLINILDDFARNVGVDVLGVADASADEIERWKDVSMATYPIYTCDGANLKMLARGNPAVVYVKNGRIVWKRTLQSIDAARVEESISENAKMESIVADYDGERRLRVLSLSYVLILIMVLILNRSYRVYKISALLIEKNKNKNVTLQNENKSEAK